MNDTDALALGGIAMHFLTLNSGLLAFLSYPSVMVSASKSFCNTASRPDRGVYFKIFPTRRNQLGTIPCRIFSWEPRGWKMFQTVVVQLDCPKHQSRHVVFEPPNKTKSMILSMMLTGLFNIDLRDMLWMMQMPSRNLTGRKDVGVKLVQPQH